VAEFFVVYIREAHAADSDWPMAVPDEQAILTPKSHEERTSVATKCCTKLDLKLPCLIDDMEDSTEKAYAAWPDRIFVVDEAGRIAVRAEPGPWGFADGVNAVARWLANRFPERAGEKQDAAEETKAPS